LRVSGHRRERRHQTQNGDGAKNGLLHDFLLLICCIVIMAAPSAELRAKRGPMRRRMEKGFAEPLPAAQAFSRATRI